MPRRAVVIMVGRWLVTLARSILVCLVTMCLSRIVATSCPFLSDHHTDGCSLGRVTSIRRYCFRFTFISTPSAQYVTRIGALYFAPRSRILTTGATVTRLGGKHACLFVGANYYINRGRELSYLTSFFRLQPILVFLIEASNTGCSIFGTAERVSNSRYLSTSRH
jgi:hypothetical protein